MGDFLLNFKATGAESFSKVAEEFVKDLDKTEKSATKTVTVMDKLATAGKRLAAAFGAKKVAEWTLEILKSAGEIKDLADRTSLTTDAIQALQFVAKATGSDLGNLVGVFESLSRIQGEIQAGIGKTGEKIESLERLGISLQSLKNGDAKKLFLDLAQRMNEGAISAEQYAAGIKLLGSAFPEFIVASKKGLAEQVKAFEESNLAIDQGTVELLDKLGSAWQNLWTTVKAGSKKFAADLVGSLYVGTSALVSGVYKLASPFSERAAKRAEELDTERALAEMGGAGDEGIITTPDGKVTSKKLIDAQNRRDTRKQLENFRNQIRKTLDPEDAELLIGDLDNRNAKPQDYERALRDAVRSDIKTARAKAASVDLGKSSEDEKATRMNGGGRPDTDALTRIGLYTGDPSGAASELRKQSHKLDVLAQKLERVAQATTKLANEE
ncbi:MAG: hypothetical protein ABS95_01095 [Verrucomicrobia bacterium SCN 57-15]|nr:MAG: hypothetical protein ABS95_01095 [Verrucomicrobia bacterium SCN 57-15]